MESFRNPKFVQRYEDTSFELNTALVTPANGLYQKKDGYRFVADNSGEIAPFDWYNARFEVDFKLQLRAGGAIANNDDHGMVNGSYSLIKKIIVKVNGVKVYECGDANQCVNIKNLLEYNSSYVKSIGTNQFYYLDTNRTATDAAGGAGFKARKVLLGVSADVNTEIPLNRYSFFESLQDELLPNTKVEIEVELESDGNVVWRTGGANCRVVFTKFKLWVPKISFTPEGESLYLSKYLKPHKWTYLKEMVLSASATNQRTGTFNITSAVNRPRHVFVWISNTTNADLQTVNPFLYNTFLVDGNQRLTSCQLEIGNGNYYPETVYQPSSERSRIYRDVLKYVHDINDFNGGTLLNRANFGDIFPFIYFNLENQKQDIKDGTTKISFKYSLEGTTTNNYIVYALILHEQDMKIFQSSGKVMFRA